MYNSGAMTLKTNGFWSTGLMVVLAVGLSAQTQPPAPSAAPAAAAAQEKPTFKVTVDLVTNDVIVRDDKGNFIPDLKKEEFEIFEDGVKQDISSMTVVTGGRVTNVLAPPPPPPPEGIILPATRPRNDVSGRIFLFFVDDLHLQFHNTGRVRELFKKISRELIHDGDMFGIVSSGPSSIAIDMTYDHKRLDEAMNKIAGNGLKPSDIIDTPDGSQGPPEVRYRAHVAFSTVYDVLKQLEQVHNRRKAFIYVSNGYDFDPFKSSRDKAQAERMGATCDNSVPGSGASSCSYPGSNGDSSSSDVNPFSQNGNNNEFAFADLAAELSELTREANRANATLYTIDPRGLVGGPDLDENVDQVEWQNHIRETQNSLRVLAEQTGGVAVVNSNDFDKALKRIDAETSDYYVLGYYSSNQI